MTLTVTNGNKKICESNLGPKLIVSPQMTKSLMLETGQKTVSHVSSAQQPIIEISEKN